MDETVRRESDLALLEAAAAASVKSPDFVAFMGLLDLSLAYRDLVVEVLGRGRWRQSEFPIKAVRSAALRAFLKRDSTSGNRKEKVGGYSNEVLGSVGFLSGTSDSIKGSDGVWRRGGGRDQAHDERDEEIEQKRSLLRRIPKRLRTTVDAPPECREWMVEDQEIADWPEIAKAAGLDQWETACLLWMVAGSTRYAAMGEMKSAADKRAIEAAWKRMERSKIERLRPVLTGK